MVADGFTLGLLPVVGWIALSRWSLTFKEAILDFFAQTAPAAERASMGVAILT